MVPELVIRGMHGLGDNLHQRAIVRQLVEQNVVWLETPWPCIYHDLSGDRLKFIGKESRLRTQQKNARRERSKFENVLPPREAKRVNITYHADDIRRLGSVLAAMMTSIPAVSYERADIRLPVPSSWHRKAAFVLDRLSPTKPVMIYRPLVERTEWRGGIPRNPDLKAYADILSVMRDRFFLISVADLAHGKEWIVGEPVEADATFHDGQLDIETLAALFSAASVVYCAPGFATILAQAVETPVVTVFGGFENSASFSAGARHSRYCPIDTIDPCQCFREDHDCKKTIDVESALHRVESFCDQLFQT